MPSLYDSFQEADMQGALLNEFQDANITPMPKLDKGSTRNENCRAILSHEYIRYNITP